MGLAGFCQQWVGFQSVREIPSCSSVVFCIESLGGGPDLRLRRRPEVAPKTDHAVISPFRIFSGFSFSNGLVPES